MQNFTCENLSFYYGKKIVLDNISFTLNKGDVLGLVGNNGVGKSTLLKILAKIYHVEKLDNYTVSFLVDKPKFYPYLSGSQNLFYYYSLCAKKLYNINAALNLIDLNGSEKEKVQNYSLGMKQKLGIAKCLLLDADIYLFDEPLNGLDAKSIYNFRIIIKNLQALGKIVIISSHIFSELEKYCNKLLIINHKHQGKVYDLEFCNQSIEQLFLMEASCD